MKALVTGATGFVGSAVARGATCGGPCGARSGSAGRRPPQSRWPRRRGRRGRLARPDGLRPGSRGLRGAVPRRRRLSALGSRPGCPLRHERRRYAGAHRGGHGGGHRANGLYLVRRHPRAPSRRHAGRRRNAGVPGRHDRPLQALEVPCRRGGAPPGPRGGRAGGHRQPLDAGRTARPQADADRAHDRRGGGRADARLRRHRAQPGPCRRRRRRSPAGLSSTARRANAMCWGPRT